MADNLNQYVSDLVENKAISQNYPDDYMFHPLPVPFAAKVDGEVLLGVLARENRQDGADFNQVALMTPVQYSEFIRNLPDAKDDVDGGAAERREFTGNKVWQDGVSGQTVSADKFSKVFYNSDTGQITDEAIAIEANAQWARKGFEEIPRPHNEVLLPEGRRIGEVVSDQDLLIETDVFGKLQKGRVFDSYGEDESEIEVPEGFEKYFYDVSTRQITHDNIAKKENLEWGKNRFENARPFDFAVLPDKFVRDGRVSADDLRAKLNDDYRLVDEIVTVRSVDGEAKAEASKFILDSAHDINMHAEMVSLGKVDADITLSSSDIQNIPNIYVEEDYQPKANVLEIPQALIDAVNNPPSIEESPVTLSTDFNTVAPDPNYAPRPEVTVVDKVREEYKEILGTGKSDFSKTADINREVGGALLRYLEGEQNFKGHDPDFLKDELHEAIADLKSFDLHEQANILEQYEQNLDSGMGRREAREVSREALDGIADQVHSVHLSQQDARLEDETARRATEAVERDLQDQLAKDAISQQWINDAFGALNNSDEAEAYKQAMIKGDGVEEAKANLDKLIEDMKAESFPNHKGIEERKAERDLDPAVVNTQLQGISSLLESSFLEKIQNSGIDPNMDHAQKAAFAESVMEGISEDSVREMLINNPDGAKQVLADGIISKMDDAIGDLKQGLYDNQDAYRDVVNGSIQDVVNSPEFQQKLKESLDEIKATALEQAEEGLKAGVADIHSQAADKMEQARRAQLNPEYEVEKQNTINIFKNFAPAQREVMLQDILQKEEKNGGLSDKQQVVKDALMELQESGGAAPVPAAGGMKP